MTRKVTKVAFKRKIDRFNWDDFEIGQIVGRYQHAGELLIPRAYQCVGKHDGRDGKLEIVLLELCFELSIEINAGGYLVGAATPLSGKFTSGEPVAAQPGPGGSLVLSGHELILRPESMRFKISESSFYLRAPNGKRFIAGEKKP